MEKRENAISSIFLEQYDVLFIYVSSGNGCFIFLPYPWISLDLLLL